MKEKIIRRVLPIKVSETEKKKHLEVTSVPAKTQRISNSLEIAQGLTLDNIEAMDISDVEKESLRDDLVYRQGQETPYEPPPSEEEILEILIEDSKELIN